MSRDATSGDRTAPLAPPSPSRRGVGGEVSQAPFLRDARVVAAARRLRAEMTDAERLLWLRLRRDQLGVRFRRQHPIGPFVVDFFAPEVRLAVELDGGQHATETSGDAGRTAWLLAEGVAVLRFWNNEVMENWRGVLVAVGSVIEVLRGRTSPLTPLRSGGGDASVDLGALGLRLSLPEVVW